MALLLKKGLGKAITLVFVKASGGLFRAHGFVMKACARILKLD
jgi:hypothetical protein